MSEIIGMALLAGFPISLLAYFALKPFYENM